MSLVSGISLKELAYKIGADLEGDPTKEVIGLNTLDSASNDEVAFIARESFLSSITSTKAGALICSNDLSKGYSGNKLIGEDPYLLYARSTKVFKELDNTNTALGISKLAHVGKNVSISEKSNVANFANVSDGVTIEDGVLIGSGVFIGENSVIRSGSKIYPNVTIYDSVEIGSNCIIHGGTVIGSDGLGFAKDKGKWVKIEHLGKVIIGDNVEIGSNTSIDRGSVGNTLIEDNVKIDNLVHLAHNVKIGSGTAIAANSAVAGSSSIGKNCTLAGCCAVVDNIEVTDEVHITAMSLITKSIKEKGVYSSGTPFMKNKDWKKNAVSFKKLHKFITSK
ncbi:MAG: UDP-3-O-(3-hydroxymyristoyl)glucosamine N-acyltransferase [Gammaproteobacteria bacterium]|nr:MAG: UDP-3-O-(3-hydroxymyristoyl)glucosamine N-acyltransferase [Gammaproteobacteria bacterium]